MVNLNDLETLLQLLMLLAKYEKSIIVHDVFKDELVDLLAKSGSEDKFLKRFESYIRQIMENGDTAIGPPGMPIEHLAGQKNLARCGSNLESQTFVFYLSTRMALYIFYLLFMKDKATETLNIVRIYQLLKRASQNSCKENEKCRTEQRCLILLQLSRKT